MSDPTTPDVIVIGGGIIGLSIAWQLSKEGLAVTVLERAQIGGQASGAAAGMLAPLAEAKGPGAFVSLGLESLQRYPALVAELLEETGIDAELIGPGMLRVALNDEEAYELGQAWEWQHSMGLELDCLSAKEVRMLEPALAQTVTMALRSPEERHVEPKRLLRALALACARRGVHIIEGEPVCGFAATQDSIHAVKTPGQRFDCFGVVVAAGAWTETLGLALGDALPIHPIRGQILALSCLPPPIRYTIYTHYGYLVPKADGRIVVGATEDEAGYDARPTVQGMATLLHSASVLVPSLTSAPFDSAWAGLRPASRDGMPILGRLSNWKNVYAACGHFRNGILLTPITAEVIAHEVLHSEAHALTEAFRPDRFSLSLTDELEN